ncbi:hypothetical protein [Streptomyces sp. NPDC058622]|uniref:hypothetical protein n=1 Tax=Streptomyces sp. NPDC058622 TaxID=3346562 RepID=UPI00365C83AB
MRASDRGFLLRFFGKWEVVFTRRHGKLYAPPEEGKYSRPVVVEAQVPALQDARGGHRLAQTQPALGPDEAEIRNHGDQASAFGATIRAASRPVSQARLMCRQVSQHLVSIVP